MEERATGVEAGGEREGVVEEGRVRVRDIGRVARRQEGKEMGRTEEEWEVAKVAGKEKDKETGRKGGIDINLLSRSFHSCTKL